MSDYVRKISDKVSIIKSKIDDISDDDISYKNLGDDYGFVQAEYSKRSIVRKMTDFIQSLESCYDLYHERHTFKCCIELIRVIDEASLLMSKISGLAEKGVENNSSYSTLRESYIDAMASNDEKIDDIAYIIGIKVDLIYLQKKTGASSFSADYESMAESSYKKIIDSEKYVEKVKSESERILETAKRNILDAGFKNAEGEFISKARIHKRFELFWLSISVLALIWMVFLVYKIVYSESTSVGDDFSVFELLRHVVQIFIPALLLSVAMKKYNAERNLNIIYSHRQIVLNQYQFFEAGLSDNVESKDKFRLEIARYIFSDPDTGYISQSSNSSEININPVISTLDSVGKAISK